MKKNKENTFFLDLKEKLEIPLTEEFDQSFWKRFGDEIPKKKSISGWKIPEFRFLLPTAALSMSIFLGVIYYQFYNQPNYQNHMGTIATMIELDPLLSGLKDDELELLGEIDTIDLTDEEWNILVGDPS